MMRLILSWLVITGATLAKADLTVRGTPLLTKNRILSTGEELGGGDLFEEPEDNGGGATVPCVYPDAYNDYGADVAYTHAALVAWTYQIQGALAMSTTTLDALIIPQIESQLGKFLVESLFDTPVCDDTDDSPAVAGLQGGDRRKLSSIQPWELTNGAKVTGLLAEPRDSLLPGFDGVNCHSPNIADITEAPRCFKLVGGIVLTGQNGEIDEAVAITQQTIEYAFNNLTQFNSLHPTMKHIEYIQAEPDYQVFFDDGRVNGEPEESASDDPTGAGSEEPLGEGENDSDDKDWPIWPWIIGGTCLITGVVAIYVVRQRRQGSFGQIRGPPGAGRGLLVLPRSSDEYSESSGSNGYRQKDTWASLREDGESSQQTSQGDADSSTMTGQSQQGLLRGRNDTIQSSSSTTSSRQPITSLLSGSFPDSPEGSGLRFVDQTGEAEIYAGSNATSTNLSNIIETDSGSSSDPDSVGSSPPPSIEGRWKRQSVV